jgi:phospholipid/cholesterol/gamma-HCH transport system ATP-binding protein
MWHSIRMFTKTIVQNKGTVDFVYRVALIGCNNYHHRFQEECKKCYHIARAYVNLNTCFCDEPNSGLDLILQSWLTTLSKYRRYDITTVINTWHELSNGNWWENFVLKDGLGKAPRRNFFRTDNEAVVAFVYSSNLMLRWNSQKINIYCSSSTSAFGLNKKTSFGA